MVVNVSSTRIYGDARGTMYTSFREGRYSLIFVGSIIRYKRVMKKLPYFRRGGEKKRKKIGAWSGKREGEEVSAEISIFR